MLDVHEPMHDTGERRTWPNMMSREGARGQEYNAWSGDGGNPPEHETILFFTRMLAGPMDFTPGIFDLLIQSAAPDGRGRPTSRGSRTTLAKQLALYVVLYSPLQMAADLPENYEGQPAFQFIRDVAVDWDTTRVHRGADRRLRGGRATGARRADLVPRRHHRRAGAHLRRAALLPHRRAGVTWRRSTPTGRRRTGSTIRCR